MRSCPSGGAKSSVSDVGEGKSGIVAAASEAGDAAGADLGFSGDVEDGDEGEGGGGGVDAGAFVLSFFALEVLVLLPLFLLFEPAPAPPLVASPRHAYVAAPAPAADSGRRRGCARSVRLRRAACIATAMCFMDWD